MDRTPSRFERVRGLLDEHGYEALLAVGADHVVHLAGYARYLGGPAAVIVLPDDERVLVVPRFELEIARAQTLADRVECYGPADFLEFGLGRLLLERCRELAGSARLAETADGTLAGELEALRRVKDDDELQRIATSYDAALAAQAAIAAAAAEGATEIELFSHGRAVAERHVGAPVEYVATVASGAGSALVSPPMHVAGAVRVGIDDVLLVDVAVRHAGYWGDSARTTVPAEHAGTVAALESIKDEAARGLRPGRRASEVYEGVRAAIASAFSAHGLPHHAGHGVGIGLGEDPQLIPAVELPLEAGMVLALEPGIYTPGRFGVRVEDLYVVTPDGGAPLQDGATT
jgi:Xaa-Pro aminopeptidase